jgi:glycosyltransferase involved in cell wall biosynthesis
MIRIVHMISGMGTGGAETMLARVVQHLDPERFASRVIALRGGGGRAEELADHGIPVHHLAGLRPFLEAMAAVGRQLPDCVQGWMYHGNLAASAVAAALRRPALWNVRASLDELPSMRRATRAVVAAGAPLSVAAAGIVYNSHLSRRQHEAAGYCSGRGLVLPNGFDVQKLGPDPAARAAVRREFGIPETAAVIGLIARYDPVKDHATFLEAFARLSTLVPGVHALVVGPGVDRSVELRQRTRGEGLAGVRLVGERRDMPAIFAALDLSVLCSRSEAFPNVVGESMACAVPCVVTDVGDAGHIVGTTGLVVPVADPTALADAITALLREATPKKEARRARARARIVERYSLAHVVSRYEKLYEIVSRRRGARACAA